MKTIRSHNSNAFCLISKFFLISHGILLIVCAIGCGSAARDFENICHAEERSGSAHIRSAADRQAAIAQWIDETITTREAREVFQALASVSTPEARSALLIEAAGRAGYTGPCPIAGSPSGQQ